MTSETPSPQPLPDAFAADDPVQDESDDQFGAGRLVESAVPRETRDARRDASEDVTDGATRVDEASEESFPGSDPPTYGGAPTA